MKKQIITISVLACLAFTGVSTVIAKSGDGHRGGKHGERGDDMRIFKNLDLSEQQKVDIKAIMQQTREDNSVFVGEKGEMMRNMRDLMNMPAWDAQTAREIISAQMEQGKDIQLNRAKAKHEVFHLLTDEQQAQLEQRKDKLKKHEGKRNGKKREGKMRARLIKALELTDEQQSQWKIYHEANKTLKESFKPSIKAHKEQERLLVQADVFDEEAWLALQNSFADEIIENRVSVAENRYKAMALLSAEQKEKFKQMMKKMKEKHAK